MFKKTTPDADDALDGADEALERFVPEDNGSSGELDDSVVAEETAAATMKKLREKLRQAEAEKQEYLTGWQRAKADLINARKRDDEDRKNFAKFAAENIITELLPVLESFNMAMGNKEAWEKADKNWRIGVEYIYSQLKKALADNGLADIDPAVGAPYDHTLHEAVAHDAVSDQKLDQTVTKVLQRGYMLNGKLVKAARVNVGEFAAAATA